MSRLSRGRGRGPKKRESGIALLMVLVFITLLGSIVGDFQYTSSIDAQLAYNARDELQAEYNAMSALRMRALVLKHGKRLEAGIKALLGGLGGEAAGAALPIGQILQMIPVECGIMSSIIKSGEDPFADDEEIAAAAEEGGGFFSGDCIATATSEHSKISLNSLRKLPASSSPGLTAQGAKTFYMLFGMLSDPKLEKHFQEDDESGSHALKPEELVGAIVDWVDDNNTQQLNQVSDEDRFYDLLRDPYEPKNAPMDSVAELRLVHGVDDELYDLLKDRVSVHADNDKVELASADELTLYWGLLAALKPGVPPATLAGPALADFLMRMQEMKSLGTIPGLGGMLTVPILTQLVNDSGLSAYIDTTKLGQIFDDKQGSTWYTIEAEGRVGNASRHITAVFQAQTAEFFYVRME